MARSVTVRAPAKVNLALSVGPPEPRGTPDAGMHPIASWMAAIDLHDDVTLTRADETTLTRRWAEDTPAGAPLGWLASDDLAVRALWLLGESAGRELKAEIALTKRIPVGGGLGGGSSDAAACLLAANELFDLGLTTQDLASVGRRIGSDVPFFLDDSPSPRPALVAQFGERIGRVRLEATDLLLIVPGFGCDTGGVYREYDQSPLTLDLERVAALARGERVAAEGLFNDLALPAQRFQPELQTLMGRLGRIIDEPIHLSGSGSTLFVVTPDADAIERAVQGRIPGVRCVRVRTLTGTEQT